MNVKKRARTTTGLRWYHRKPIVRVVHAGNLIVADDLDFNSKRLECFDNSLDMARSTTGLCAWSGRRTKINDSKF